MCFHKWFPQFPQMGGNWAVCYHSYHLCCHLHHFVLPLVPFVLPLVPFVLPLAPFVLPLVPFVLPLAPFVLPLAPFVLPLAPFVLPRTCSPPQLPHSSGSQRHRNLTGGARLLGERQITHGYLHVFNLIGDPADHIRGDITRPKLAAL